MEGKRTVQARDSFHLEIDGISGGSFLRCSGLAARVDVFEHAEGGSDRARKLRGDLTHSNICLERGVVRGQELYDWFLKGDLRNGAVVLLSREGKETARWSFLRGWPCRWEGPVLDAREAGVALELLEIAHEGIQCVQR
jgi:phage tail-like protein